TPRSTPPLRTSSRGHAQHRRWSPPSAAGARRSAPAGLTVRVDPERQLPHRLTAEQVVAGMDAAEAGIAEQLLHAVAAEDARAAGELHRHVDDLPGAAHHVVLRGDQLERPLGTVIRT